MSSQKAIETIETKLGQQMPVPEKVAEATLRDNVPTLCKQDCPPPASRIHPVLEAEASPSRVHSLIASYPKGYAKRLAACLALCQLVEQGERQVMELRRRYPQAANSHRAMLQRRRTDGAVVCDEWLTLLGYLRSVGPNPAPKWTMDKENPSDPEYAPHKCRWAPPLVQTGNRRCTVRFVDANGRAWSPEELGKVHRVSPDTIRRRRTRDGWTDAEIIAGERPKPAGPRAAKQKTFLIPERPPALHAVWAKGMTATYPGEWHQLSKAEFAMLKVISERLEGGGFRDRQHRLFDYAIRNWEDVIDVAKDWLGAYPLPSRPSVAFMQKYLRAVVSIWLEGNSLEYRDGLVQPKPLPIPRPGNQITQVRPFHVHRLAEPTRELQEGERLVTLAEVLAPLDPEAALKD